MMLNSIEMHPNDLSLINLIADNLASYEAAIANDVPILTIVAELQKTIGAVNRGEPMK